MTDLGRACIVWPRDGWAKLDLPKIAATIVTLGFDTVVLHDGTGVADEALVHIDAARTRAGVFKAAGLRVALGLGFPKPHPGNLDTIVQGILHTQDLDFAYAYLDLEGAWEGHQQDARHIVDAVRAHYPKPPVPITLCTWGEPYETPDGHPTHPSFPTAEVLELVAMDTPLCPQVYDDGLRVGTTAIDLAWSRKQYAPRPVVPTIQAYRHKRKDRIDLMLSEPSWLTWDWVEFDREFMLDLRVVREIRARGFTSVREYQAAEGLVADGLVGPRTLAALGLLPWGA